MEKVSLQMWLNVTWKLNTLHYLNISAWLSALQQWLKQIPWSHGTPPHHQTMSFVFIVLIRRDTYRETSHIVSFYFFKLLNYNIMYYDLCIHVLKLAVLEHISTTVGLHSFVCFINKLYFCNFVRKILIWKETISFVFK